MIHFVSDSYVWIRRKPQGISKADSRATKNRLAPMFFAKSMGTHVLKVIHYA
jgi:hypothetical protein